MDGGNTFPGSEPHTLAELAADNGFGHLTFQWDYLAQRPLLGDAKEACHDLGLTFGVWCADPRNGVTALQATGADHVVLQAEQPQDWPTIVTELRQAYPDVPAAVVTTFWGIGATGDGYDPSISKPVVDAGFKCLTEAYVVSDPNATPARLNFTATQKLGWEASQPAIGVYGGYPAEKYVTDQQLASWPGYWVWLAETMTERDWAALKEVNLA